MAVFMNWHSFQVSGWFPLKLDLYLLCSPQIWVSSLNLFLLSLEPTSSHPMLIIKFCWFTISLTIHPLHFSISIVNVLIQTTINSYPFFLPPFSPPSLLSSLLSLSLTHSILKCFLIWVSDIFTWGRHTTEVMLCPCQCGGTWYWYVLLVVMLTSITWLRGCLPGFSTVKL